MDQTGNNQPAINQPTINQPTINQLASALTDQTFIIGAIFSLANRLQTLGDRIDPAVTTKQWFVLAVVARFFEHTPKPTLKPTLKPTPKPTPPSISEIARLIGTSHQNIKKLAVILEHKGLIEMRKDVDDRRCTRLFLTEKCYDYFKIRQQEEEEYIHELFDGTDDQAIHALREGLHNLINTADKMLD